MSGGGIILRGVGLDAGGARILEGIDWTVAPGEKWAVLGLNGSGKTSLLRILAGFGFPSRGSVSVLGEGFGTSDLRLLRRRIGWVHGDLAAEFPRFMTAVDVVESGADGATVVYEDRGPEAARRAGDALATVGAGSLAGRLFATLSTGERQRVLIARALAAEPSLLLLDEPCLGLDPVARDDFLCAVEALFRGRPELTVIGVTHHVEEIVEGYGRVLLLASGRAAASGEPAEVLADGALRQVYGPRCRVQRVEGRWALRFTGPRGGR